MAKELKVYKGEEVVETVEVGENGSARATIPNLEPGTEYAKGTFTVTFANESGESDKVDVPGFTTQEAEDNSEDGEETEPEA